LVSKSQKIDRFLQKNKRKEPGLIFSNVFKRIFHNLKVYAMKTNYKIIGLLFVISATASCCYVSQSVAQSPDENYQPEAEISFSTFYDDLSSYGQWMDYPSYGRVWICNEAGFRPYYSGGHWAYTTYGWTWVSDYDWGWAPFHYGRWSFDAGYGWFWVPGYEWAPAWVGWRSGGGCYGWVPLGPGIHISIGASWGGIQADRWCFVPNRYMGYSNISRYYVSRVNNTTIIHNTTIINNINVYRNARYIAGPEPNEVERYSGRRIEPLQVNDTRRPEQTHINNRGLNIYRPVVRRNDERQTTPGFPSYGDERRGNRVINDNRPDINNTPVTPQQLAASNNDEAFRRRVSPFRVDYPATAPLQNNRPAPYPQQWERRPQQSYQRPFLPNYQRQGNGSSDYPPGNDGHGRNQRNNNERRHE